MVVLPTVADALLLCVELLGLLLEAVVALPLLPLEAVSKASGRLFAFGARQVLDHRLLLVAETAKIPRLRLDKLVREVLRLPQRTLAGLFRLVRFVF